MIQTTCAFDTATQADWDAAEAAFARARSEARESCDRCGADRANVILGIGCLCGDCRFDLASFDG